MTKDEIVAEMAVRLGDLIELCYHADVHAWENGVTSPMGDLDEGNVLAGRCIDSAREILDLYHSKHASRVAPYDFMSAWNLQVNLPRIKSMSADRKTHLRQRAQEQFFVDNFVEGIRKVASSSFCTGSNDRGWKATVDWFLRPGSLAKVMEGKYDNKVKPTVRTNAVVDKTPLKDYLQKWKTNSAVEQPVLPREFNPPINPDYHGLPYTGINDDLIF